MASLKQAALVALALGCLAFPAGALAAASSQAGYSGPGGVVQSDVAGAASGSGRTAAQPVRGGGSTSLPFTGFDVLLLAGAGVLLMGGGLALRRLSGAGVRV